MQSIEGKSRKEKIIDTMNRYSLLLHAVLACGICFAIEWISRHSFVEACEFVVDRNLVFLYNSFIVWASLTLVYVFRRRMFARTVISAFWLILGIVNGCILAQRVTPFGWTDLKMVSELFTLQSNYFTIPQAVVVIILSVLLIISLVILCVKGPKFRGKTHRMAGAVLIMLVVLMLPGVTDAAQNNNILATYFENLAQGYKDYGFIYSFSSSALDVGMSTPEGYSEEAVQNVLNKTESAAAQKTDTEDGAGPGEMTAGENTGQTASLTQNTIPKTSSAYETESETESEITEVPGETEDWEYPNIVVVLLESFANPDMINFLECSEEPVPNFEYLYDHYTSGYVEVPVVGAGTANTEFEILTGMSMQFFGLGEIPQKTVLLDIDSCESIASDLKTIGYGTHVVHDNGGNFYSRANAFSKMGFDTFTCKEMIDIHDYTPIGTWPTDHVMIPEIEKALDYTPDQPDFLYVITVGSHGNYPQYEVLEDPEIKVKSVEDEGMAYSWEYYVNMLHDVDVFIGELIDLLEERGEPTYVAMFGDHLPTMGLTEDDMVTGDLFAMKYVTWNNLGMEKKDRDMTAYQFLADILEDLGLDGVGTMFTFHQNRDSCDTEEAYLDDLEMLQYDLLYGERYAYGGEDLYPASDLIMGTQDVVIDQLMEIDDYCYVIGENFTKWSKIYVDDEKVSTTYYSSTMLRFNKEKLKLSEGDHSVVVNQVGSSNTIFRSSNVAELEVEAQEDE